MDLSWALPIATGVVTGVVVAYATHRWQASLERERWTREDAIRSSDLDRQAKQRWASDLRQLFATLIRQSDDLRDISRDLFDGDQQVADWVPLRADAFQTAMEIALIAPAMADVAQNLFYATHDLVESAVQWSHKNDDGVQAAAEDDREKASLDAYEAFFEAAKEFLKTIS